MMTATIGTKTVQTTNATKITKITVIATTTNAISETTTCPVSKTTDKGYSASNFTEIINNNLMKVSIK